MDLRQGKRAQNALNTKSRPSSFRGAALMGYSPFAGNKYILTAAAYQR